MKMSAHDRQVFLAAPHIGVLSVDGGPDRPPLTAPTWYAYEPGGNLTFFTNTEGRQTRKAASIERTRLVSFCVQQEAFPYKYVTIEGTVVAIDRPPTAAQIVAIVRRYLPEEATHGFAQAELNRPDAKIVLYSVRPDRWLTVDYSGEG